jgi:hypothetical protein
MLLVSVTDHAVETMNVAGGKWTLSSPSDGPDRDALIDKFPNSSVYPTR